MAATRGPGFKIVLEGKDAMIATDADFENLRSFSRNIVKAAEAYGLGVATATVEPAQGTTEVGVTPAEQAAAADKQEQAKATRAQGQAEAAREAQLEAEVKAAKADNK